MNRSRGFVLVLAMIAMIIAVIALPFERRTQASEGFDQRTTSHEADLPNYDIRTDKSAFEKIAASRSASGKNAIDVADIRDGFVRGENDLKQSIPTLKIDYNDDIRIPEVIGPDVKQGRAFLTTPATIKRSDILVNFLKQNTELVGVTTEQIDGLSVVADYTNPDNNLSFVELNQAINGVSVFRGEVKAGFTKRGEMIRVINNLAPGIDSNSVSNDFGDPIAAVKSAASNIKTNISKLDLGINKSVTTDLKTVFGNGDMVTTAEKMYFPTEPGVAIAAWRVLIWLPINAFCFLVDAKTGTILWRKNITEDQTQSATYRVWNNPSAFINVADSPFPATPGPNSPNGQQPGFLARSSITRIGNEPPYTFNNNGWMMDGINTTDGNAVEAGVDRDSLNGIDVNGKPVPAPNRVFDYAINPGNPSGVPNAGDSPLPPGSVPGTCAPEGTAPEMIEFQKATATQLFYIVNWYHDEAYRLGFTESAFNFQHDNFGRGGVQGDRISAEAQECTGSNGGNFSTAPDGNRGRMQLYIWTAPTPDFDGALDADVAVHELTHGLSNRLHGNASGLTINMARGMGEGWSDFYAHAFLSEPTDPIHGIYTVGGYTTYLGQSGYINNYYYGIRRFPKAVFAFTGANGKPHNPLTFADADQSKLDLSDGAFGRGPFGSSTADAVHNLGEIWSSALWEVRARMIARLGPEAGNRKILQLVTDGMKLAPLGPTFLTERDAILAAAQASSLAPEAASDVSDVWAGFAIRGMGVSATIQANGSGSGDTRVTEAFDTPNLFQTPTLTISDTSGNNNGFPDPGEMVAINIPLTNSTGMAATGVTLQLVGGGSANYGTIAAGITSAQPVTFTVPTNSVCGSLITLGLNVNSSLGPASFLRTFSVGQPIVTTTENFDGVTAPAIPNGWVATPVQDGINFVTSTASANSVPNAAFAFDPATIGGGTDLTSPLTNISSAAATVTFRHRYITEGGWDGGALEISIGGGAFQDIIVAGGSFAQNGYNGTLSNGTNNPLANRPAWNGTSGGFITTIARLPAAAAQQNVQLRWRFGADNNTAPAGGGWYIDNIQVVGNYSCIVIDNFGKARADFDGDSRTDLSVFRPVEGNWYLNRSNLGFTVLHFGLSDDVPTPGDFDGDRKADVAVFRPTDGNWYRLNSGNGQFSVTHFGSNGDVPQAGDFDGDGKDDLAVWRPTTGIWYWLGSLNGQINSVQFGLSGDRAVAGDFDGDSKDDIAIWRPSTGVWYRINSSNGQISTVAFGLPNDLPTQADYDGDSITDIAVFRPSNGIWYRLNSSNGQFAVINFGLSGDVPIPGDYDGDGKDDQAVYRNGIWYLNRSTAGFAAAAFGLTTDIPLPKAYIP